MKTADELAVSYLGPESHKRRSTTLRRLSGGLETEIKSAEATGLSQTELKTLRQATIILNKLGSEFARASTIAKKRHEEAQNAEAAIRKAMANNFGKLSSVSERVALIGAVNSYLLREDSPASFNNREELDFWFREELGSLAYRLAGQAKGRKADTVVAEAWAMFDGARSELEGKFRHIIRKIEAADSKTVG